MIWLKSSENFEYFMYADETTLNFQSETRKVEINVNEKVNNVILNLSKTKYCIFQIKKTYSFKSV